MVLTSISAVAQNRMDNQGRRQGHWVRTDKDGSKIYEGEFVDGLETGTFTYYYHDGSVRMRNVYSEPGKRCRHEAFDEQGRLLADGWYNQRNRDGEWHFYAEDGRMVKLTTYSMGIKHGLQVVFNQKGDTAEVCTWNNNHRHGRWWKRIGKNGYVTGRYVNGGIEGRLVEYDDAGVLVREGYYADGLKHGTYRYYEGGKMTVDELWSHGLLADRKIRLLLPEEEFVSVFDIACMAPQGKNRVIVYLRNGEKKTTREGADEVYARVGNEIFGTANRKSRILVSRRCLQGLGKDAEGRTILLMEPQPDFDIFPDEDGEKMVRSHQYDDEAPLEKLQH